MLHQTIATMKELEKRVGTSTVQGDMLAGAVDDLEHRVSVIQKALLHPQQGDASMPGAIGALRAARGQGSSPAASSVL